MSPRSLRRFRLPGHLFRYAGFGATATAAHYTVLIFLVHFGRLDPVISSGLGFAVGAVISYRLNYAYTFHSDKRHREAFSKFLGVGVVGLSLNTLLMGVLTKILLLHYLLAQVIATGIVFAWNFTVNSLWSFR